MCRAAGTIDNILESGPRSACPSISLSGIHTQNSGTLIFFSFLMEARICDELIALPKHEFLMACIL